MHRKYVWGLGLAYAVDGSGNVLVYHTDGLGSVRVLTDANGSVVQSYSTDEYGVPTASQGSIEQPFRYTGEQYDSETGLVYLRARMYDPGTGRFVSRDSMAGKMRSPTSLNRFIYVHDNPTTLTDPSGHAVRDELLQACSRHYGSEYPCDELATPGVIEDHAAQGQSYGIGDWEASPVDKGLFILSLARGGIASAPKQPIAGVITGFRTHGMNQVITRGIRPYEVLDAVSNPVRVRMRDNDTVQYIGQWAMIVVNKAGEVVTAVRFKPPWAP